MPMSLGIAGGAAANETTLVLHALAVGSALPCEIDDPCLGPGPAVEVDPLDAPHHAILVARNYQEPMTGLRCAFDWDPGWQFVSGNWGCLPGALAEITPVGPGPQAGSLLVVFDCIQAGTSAVVGWLIFGSATEGCVQVIESSIGCGLCTLECDPGETPIHPKNVGRVCVGPGGSAPCDPVATPVRAETWSRIKGQYQAEAQRR